MRGAEIRIANHEFGLGYFALCGKTGVTPHKSENRREHAEHQVSCACDFQQLNPFFFNRLRHLPPCDGGRQQSAQFTNLISLGYCLLKLRRPADLLLSEVELYVDVVGDLDERNTLVHPVVLTVEDHCSCNLV